MTHITRISKIKGFKNILAGRDLGGVFKEGHVYGFTRVGDQIIAEDLGEHATIKNHNAHTYAQIMSDGTYLLTEKEKPTK